MTYGTKAAAKTRQPTNGEQLPCVGGPRDGQTFGCTYPFPWLPMSAAGFTTSDGHEYRRDGLRWVYVKPKKTRAKRVKP
jgi:hypothetical protein